MDDLNDLDATTFARFAERFSRIERLVPDPPSLTDLMAIGSRGRTRRSPLSGWAGVVVLLVAVGGLALIGARLLPTMVAVPPDAATAAEVLDAYLRAVQAGDCETAEQLTHPSQFGPGMVDLCGITGVTAFSVVGDPVVVHPDMVRMKASLTITGTSGISAGKISFTYFLQQQGSGAWRIVDGGAHTSPSLLPWRVEIGGGNVGPLPAEMRGLVQTTALDASRTVLAHERETGWPDDEIAWGDGGCVLIARFEQYPMSRAPNPPPPYPVYLVRLASELASTWVMVDARNGELGASIGDRPELPCEPGGVGVVAVELRPAVAADASELAAAAAVLAARAASMGLDVGIRTGDGVLVLDVRSGLEVAAIFDLLLVPGRLSFVPVPPALEPPSVGAMVNPDWGALFGDAAIDRAASNFGSDPVDGGSTIEIALHAGPANEFADWTQSHIGEHVVIALDGRVLSAPMITEPIPGGRVVIQAGSGGFDQAEARRIVALMQSGPLLIDLRP